MVLHVPAQYFELTQEFRVGTVGLSQKGQEEQGIVSSRTIPAKYLHRSPLTRPQMSLNSATGTEKQHLSTLNIGYGLNEPLASDVSISRKYGTSEKLEQQTLTTVCVRTTVSRP